MITDINLQLDKIDHHLDNIRELTRGLSDGIAEDVLRMVVDASDKLDEAHALMIWKGNEQATPPWDN